MIDILAIFLSEYTEETRKALWDEFRHRSLDERLIQEKRESHRESLKDFEKRKNQELRVVKSFPSRLYADQAKELLDSEGIWSLITGTDLGMISPIIGFGTDAPSGGVTLSVLKEDYERAINLVEGFFDHI